MSILQYVSSRGWSVVTGGVANNATVPDSFLPSWNEYGSIEINQKLEYEVTSQCQHTRIAGGDITFPFLQFFDLP